MLNYMYVWLTLDVVVGYRSHLVIKHVEKQKIDFICLLLNNLKKIYPKQLSLYRETLSICECH